jgi:hypothetical protein
MYKMVSANKSEKDSSRTSLKEDLSNDVKILPLLKLVGYSL